MLSLDLDACAMVCRACAAEIVGADAPDLGVMNGCARSSAAVGRAWWLNSNVRAKKSAASGEISLGLAGRATWPICR